MHLLTVLLLAISSNLDNLGVAIALALALTMNNLANAFGAGLSGLNPLLLAGAVFLFSIITFCMGIEIGMRYTSQWLGERAGLAAGLLLVLIGLYELFI